MRGHLRQIALNVVAPLTPVAPEYRDPRPEEARASLSARRLEGQPEAKSCPLPSFETVTRSKLRVTSSG